MHVRRHLMPLNPVTIRFVVSVAPKLQFKHWQGPWISPAFNCTTASHEVRQKSVASERCTKGTAVVRGATPVDSPTRCYGPMRVTKSR